MEEARQYIVRQELFKNIINEMFGIETLERRPNGILVATMQRPAYPEEMELLGLEPV